MLEKFFHPEDLTVAKEIAEKIINHFPVRVEAKLQYIGGQRRLGGVLEGVMREIDAYQARENMGWMRKARFVNTIKWVLKDGKYSDIFVDAVTEGITLQLMMDGKRGHDR